MADAARVWPHTVRRPRLALGDGAATRVGFRPGVRRGVSEKGVAASEKGVVALEKGVVAL